jgi:hypothetical protein
MAGDAARGGVVTSSYARWAFLLCGLAVVLSLVAVGLAAWALTHGGFEAGACSAQVTMGGRVIPGAASCE